jgi:hypothetical protein
VDRVAGRAGSIAWTGAYRYEPERARPHVFDIAAEEADAAEVERLLMPVLRRGGGFLSRTFGFGRAPVPEWLIGRQAEGTVKIGVLRLGQWAVERVRGRMLWDGTGVEFGDLEGRLAGAEVKGKLAVNLRGRAPVYELSAEAAAREWKSGRLKASVILETSGVGRQLLENLRSEGMFEGESLEVDPSVEVESVIGLYQLRWGPDGPAVQFTDLKLVTGETLYAGKGATQADGQLRLDFVHEGKQLRLSGSLAQLHADRLEVSGP